MATHPELQSTADLADNGITSRSSSGTARDVHIGKPGFWSHEETVRIHIHRFSTLPLTLPSRESASRQNSNEQDRNDDTSDYSDSSDDGNENDNDNDNAGLVVDSDDDDSDNGDGKCGFASANFVCHGYKWTLQLFPNGICKQWSEAGYVSVYLQPQIFQSSPSSNPKRTNATSRRRRHHSDGPSSRNQTDVVATGLDTALAERTASSKHSSEVLVADFSLHIPRMKTKKTCLKPEVFTKSNSSLGWPNFEKRQRILKNNVCLHDTLTIVLKLKVLKSRLELPTSILNGWNPYISAVMASNSLRGDQQVAMTAAPAVASSVSTPLQNDLRNMLRNEISADISFLVGVKSKEYVRAHRCILESRLPTLASMVVMSSSNVPTSSIASATASPFSSLNSSAALVELEDIDVDRFRSFLDYIYTDDAAILDEMGPEALQSMLQLANRFGCWKLKLCIESRLIYDHFFNDHQDAGKYGANKKSCGNQDDLDKLPCDVLRYTKDDRLLDLLLFSHANSCGMLQEALVEKITESFHQYAMRPKWGLVLQTADLLEVFQRKLSFGGYTQGNDSGEDLDDDDYANMPMTVLYRQLAELCNGQVETDGTRPMLLKQIRQLEANHDKDQSGLKRTSVQDIDVA